MGLVTQPLRDEHQELLPRLERLRMAADSIESGRVGVDAVDRAYQFLSEHLLVHALAEEEVLYPVVAGIMGSPDATKTMEIEHAEVRRLTEALGELRTGLLDGALSAGKLRDLRRVLYGLYTLVGVHFLKEESVYLPLLDKSLSAEEGRALFANMETAAARAREN